MAGYSYSSDEAAPVPEDCWKVQQLRHHYVKKTHRKKKKTRQPSQESNPDEGRSSSKIHELSLAASNIHNKPENVYQIYEDNEQIQRHGNEKIIINENKQLQEQQMKQKIEHSELKEDFFLMNQRSQALEEFHQFKNQHLNYSVGNDGQNSNISSSSESDKFSGVIKCYENILIEKELKFNNLRIQFEIILHEYNKSQQENAQLRSQYYDFEEPSQQSADLHKCHRIVLPQGMIRHYKLPCEVCSEGSSITNDDEDRISSDLPNVATKTHLSARSDSIAQGDGVCDEHTSNVKCVKLLNDNLMFCISEAIRILQDDKMKALEAGLLSGQDKLFAPKDQNALITEHCRGSYLVQMLVSTLANKNFHLNQLVGNCEDFIDETNDPAELKKLIYNSQNECNDVKQEKIQLKQQMQSLLQQQCTVKVADQMQASDLQVRLNKQAELLKLNQQNNDNLQTKYDQLNKDNDHLISNIQQLTDMNSQVIGQRENLKSQLDKLQQNVNEMHTKQTEKLIEQRTVEQMELKNLQRNHHLLQCQYDQLRLQLINTEKRLEEVQLQINQQQTATQLKNSQNEDDHKLKQRQNIGHQNYTEAVKMNDAFRKELQEKNQLIFYLENELEKVVNNNEKLQQDVLFLKRQQIADKKLANQFKDEKDSLLLTNSDLSNNNEQLKVQYKEIQNNLEMSEKNFRNLSDQMNSANISLKDKILLLEESSKQILLQNGELQEKKLDLTEELAQVRNVNSRLNQDRERYTSEMLQLRTKVADLNSQYKQLHNEYALLRDKTLLDYHQIKKLQESTLQQASETTSENYILCKQKKVLQCELQTSIEKCNELQQTLDVLQSQNTEYKSSQQSSLEKYDQRHTELMLKYTQLSAEKEDVLSQLKVSTYENQQIKSALLNKQQERDLSQNTLIKIQQDYESLKLINHNLQQESQNLRYATIDDVNATHKEINELNEEISNLKKQLQTFSLSDKGKQAQIEKMGIDITNKQQIIDDLQSKKLKSNENQKMIELKKDQMQNQLTIFNKQLKQQNKQIKILEHDNETSAKSYEISQKKILELTEKNQTLIEISDDTKNHSDNAVRNNKELVHYLENDYMFLNNLLNGQQKQQENNAWLQQFDPVSSQKILDTRHRLVNSIRTHVANNDELQVNYENILAAKWTDEKYIDRLILEISEMQKEKGLRSKDIHDLNKQIGIQTANIKQMIEENMKSAITEKTMTSQYNQSVDQYRKLQADHYVIIANQQELKDLIVKYKDQLLSKDKEESQLQDLIGKCEGQLLSKDKEESQLQDLIGKYEGQLLSKDKEESQPSKIDKAENARLMKQVKQLTIEYKHLMNEEEHLLQQCEVMKEEHDASHEEWKVQFRKLQTEEDRKQVLLDQLQRENETQKSKLDQSAERLQLLQEEISQHINHYAVLHRENKEIQDQLQNKINENMKLHTKLDILKEDTAIFDRQRKIIEDQVETIRYLTEKLQQQAHEIDGDHKLTQQLRDKNISPTSQNEKYLNTKKFQDNAAFKTENEIQQQNHAIQNVRTKVGLLDVENIQLQYKIQQHESRESEIARNIQFHNNLQQDHQELHQNYKLLYADFQKKVEELKETQELLELQRQQNREIMQQRMHELAETNDDQLDKVDKYVQNIEDRYSDLQEEYKLLQAAHEYCDSNRSSQKAKENLYKLQLREIKRHLNLTAKKVEQQNQKIFLMRQELKALEQRDIVLVSPQYRSSRVEGSPRIEICPSSCQRQAGHVHGSGSQMCDLGCLSTERRESCRHCRQSDHFCSGHHCLTKYSSVPNDSDQDNDEQLTNVIYRNSDPPPAANVMSTSMAGAPGLRKVKCHSEKRQNETICQKRDDLPDNLTDSENQLENVE